jgi:hypothetical protein
MSEEATMQQPSPSGSGEDVAAIVCADIEARVAKGEQTYGQRLQTNNGRDAMIDAYQEALDLAIYLRQHISQLTTALDQLEKAKKALREIQLKLDPTYYGVGMATATKELCFRLAASTLKELGNQQPQTKGK